MKLGVGSLVFPPAVGSKETSYGLGDNKKHSHGTSEPPL